MDDQIKKMLQQIEKTGFDAYVIGGYVRDFLLGRKSYDVDICTNALPKDLSNIFNIPISKDVPYGSFKIRTTKYNFDITTFRSEKTYENRRPTEVSYIDNLEEDIIRRDFTINSLCMNKNGKIIDFLNAQTDIYSREIKVIGDIKTKLEEDPLRILRAVRFATILDFKLEKQLYNFIKANAHLVEPLSFTRKKEEISLILSSKNAIKGLRLIKELKLCEPLEISYNRVKYVCDLSGMWVQINYSSKYQFTKQEQSNINSLKEILKEKKINNQIIYKYDLYISMVAGNILGIPNKRINEMYKNLVIYNKNELNYKYQNLIQDYPNINKKRIKELFSDIEIKVVNGVVKNNENDIRKYIENNKWKWLS